jgi:ubiquinone/menaquinone biosynthesis C-methylase UbiE
MSTSLRNQRTYNSRDVVWSFSLRSALQPPESTILALLEPHLPGARVLDVGVGGGRTALHLLPRAREYTGIDYAPRMVAACRRRFPQHSERFHLGDARCLDGHRSDAYDFVMFSYNGIDYLSHADRLAALMELRRVTRSGGWFCMSSHNIEVLDVRLPPQPFSFAALTRALKLRMLNPGRDWTRRGAYTMVRDMLRTVTYHVSATEQLSQLTAAGFVDVRVFDRSGEQLTLANAQGSKDEWLYYLCRTPLEAAAG